MVGAPVRDSYNATTKQNKEGRNGPHYRHIDQPCAVLEDSASIEESGEQERYRVKTGRLQSCIG